VSGRTRERAYFWPKEFYIGSGSSILKASSEQPHNMAEQQEMSKGAKRRANKKAREADAPDDKPAPQPKAETPEPKAKAKGKAKAEPKAEAKPEPKAEPKAKAKAEGKAKAKAEPKGKAEAKAKAQPKSEPKPEATTEAPKAAAKAPAKKQNAKPKKEAPKVEEEEPKKREPSPDRFLQYDDGTGDAWETCTGVSKKQQKRKERIESDKVQSKAQAASLGLKEGSVAMNQHVVGLTVSSDKAANTAGKKFCPSSRHCNSSCICCGSCREGKRTNTTNNNCSHIHGQGSRPENWSCHWPQGSNDKDDPRKDRREADLGK
jgi:hypothetical protein